MPNPSRFFTSVAADKIGAATELYSPALLTPPTCPPACPPACLSILSPIHQRYVSFHNPAYLRLPFKQTCKIKVYTCKKRSAPLFGFEIIPRYFSAWVLYIV